MADVSGWVPVRVEMHEAGRMNLSTARGQSQDEICEAQMYLSMPAAGTGRRVVPWPLSCV